MSQMRHAAILLLTLSLGACAAKAQVRTEPPMPVLDPPPPPPRVVAVYAPEPEPIPVTTPAEPATPVRPPARPTRPEQRPEPPVAAAPEPAGTAAKPPSGPSLTLSPTPGSEAQTVAAIRDLLGRATRDLARVNAASLDSDGHAQYETARRFIQQAEEALKNRNVVFAGKLADKAATMAAVLVR